MTPLCRSCERPVKDGSYVCSRCASALERDLGDVTWLAEQLEITITRQSRTGGRGIGVVVRSSEKPLPFDPHASAVAVDFRGVLVAWSLLVSEERGERTPRDTLAAMGTYLLGSVEWLRHHPAGDEAFDELRDAVQRARSAVDSAPERLYVGPCDPEGLVPAQEDPDDTSGPHSAVPCLNELYAAAGKSYVTCDVCGLVWKVQDRREFLLASASDQLATAAALSRFLTAYGEPLTAERIRQWVHRERLVSHGRDRFGDPTYRVGDVVELLAALPQAGQRRTA